MTPEESVSTCPTCGGTTITFDPPLYFEASEMCGVLKPGNYAASGYPIPECNLAAGHEGEHVALMEFTEQWPEVAS